MSELSISYFKDLLRQNNKELKARCKEWEKISVNADIPEDVVAEIRTTIGLTNLLMDQKLKQFGDLIDDSENERGEQKISFLDLQGFWDMVYFQVEKLQATFKRLEACRKNDWTFVEEAVIKKEVKRKSDFAATAKTLVNAKAHALAARQRLAEAKLKMRAEMAKKMAAERKAKMEEQNGQSNIEIHIQSTLKNVENLNTLEEESLPGKVRTTRSGGSQHLLKGALNKKSDVRSAQVGKENSQKQVPFDSEETAVKKKKSNNKSASSKKTQVTPLQCVTRAARKAMVQAVE